MGGNFGCVRENSLGRDDRFGGEFWIGLLGRLTLAGKSGLVGDV